MSAKDKKWEAIYFTYSRIMLKRGRRLGSYHIPGRHYAEYYKSFALLWISINNKCM